MSDLFGIMNSSAGALKAFQNALSVTQNNVSNSQTPGYVKQIPVFDALPFDSQGGLAGGVQAGTPQSTRNDFAETAVRRQVSLQGNSSQLAASVDPIEQVFSVTGTGGIGNALDALFQSFSAWSASPNDGSARAGVLNSASQVAAAFQASARQLSDIRTSVNGDLQTTVDAINQAAAQIRQYNVSQHGSTPDPGLDAQLNATLEQLAQYADVQTLKQPDGTVSVLLGGEVPLVLGDQVNPLRVAYPTAADAANPSATPDAAIIDSSGTDVTAKLADGQIGALLSVRNEVLPKLIGGPQDTGDLNTLAASLADKVNGVLSNAGGLPLFTYDSSNATTAASTLALNTALQPQDLVSASSGPPASSNGAALALSNLGSDPTQGPNGTTFGQYYAGLASSIGAQLSQAQTSSDAQKQTVTQARSLRDQLSGVSLDEEALRLIQLQRSYQAASRMVTVVDQMLQSVIDMVQ